ncbi:hypothetical protein IC582_012148 [Cucumis melo]|uniref:Uncharacterized protein LOC103483158 n=1 Tax=Cucumis melo TaxID=3656 RepID=A0A1S3AV38_CUCME|nr:uncharacterized protein LOC103483158 [Cucumis melo]
MANLPRFGRARQRLPAVPPPVPAAAQPAVEPRYQILPFATTITTPAPASPRRESPRPLSSPPKKATSPFASPKYGDSGTRLDRSPAAKATMSPPDSVRDKYFERRNGETTPPLSPAKSRRAKTPPLSPLALPRNQVFTGNGTTAQPRVQPEVETKGIVYNKTIEKPSKSNRSSGEYGSSKSHQKKQKPEVIKLKGHNVGAVMEINKSSTGYHLGGETLKKNETEDVGDVHGYGHEDKKTETKKKEPPITAFMNSNFQSVNNSLLFDSSCNHRDPGLHLAFPDAVDGDGAIVDGQKSYKPKRQ